MSGTEGRLLHSKLLHSTLSARSSEKQKGHVWAEIYVEAWKTGWNVNMYCFWPPSACVSLPHSCVRRGGMVCPPTKFTMCTVNQYHCLLCRCKWVLCRHLECFPRGGTARKANSTPCYFCLLIFLLTHPYQFFTHSFQTSKFSFHVPCLKIKSVHISDFKMQKKWKINKTSYRGCSTLCIQAV